MKKKKNEWFKERERQVDSVKKNSVCPKEEFKISPGVNYLCAFTNTISLYTCTDTLFLVVPSDRTGGNGHKLKHMKFHLKQKKTLFYCEGTQTLEEVA